MIRIRILNHTLILFLFKNKVMKKKAPSKKTAPIKIEPHKIETQVLSNQVQAQQSAQLQQQTPQMQQQSAQLQQQPRQLQLRQPVMRGQVMNRVQQRAFFDDDEAIMEKVKEVKAQEAKIDIQIKAQRTMIKLKEQTIIPAMCSIKTSGGVKSNVDLICVIDTSGSMSGQKIQLVKDTMKFLIETLTPADRLSIITFSHQANRVNGLKCVTNQNLVSFTQNINSLQSGGGTDINSGMELALKTIRDRKFKNSVTSVFLLSDGQDSGAEHKFAQSLKDQKNNDLGVFTIHSFGFGTDHDEELMTKICQEKDGSFYFIKQLATLDEAFCNALGGIISIVANEVTIKLNNISKNLMEGTKILRTFGTMWKKISDNQYRIQLLQLMSGISKDYVFEIGFPNINTQVGDLNRDHDVIQAIFTAKGVKGENINGECCLKMTLLNQNEDIPQINQNVDVIENYLRVQASQVIEENMKKAEKQDYDGAQKGIDHMINAIQNNKKVRKEKMENLVQDLQNIKAKCSKQDYEQQGKKWMKSAKMAHSKQSNYAYSNSVQQEMVMKQKAKKM